MNAACVVCHTTTEPLTASGRCRTCESQLSETKAAPPDEFAPTASGQPDLDTLSAASSDTSDPLLPPGGYELIEELGAGGMGLVWKAKRLSTGQFVAIKKLRPESFTPTGFRRFVAEARAIEVVDHANVVRLLDFVPDPADPFLVLEYVPGKNLAELLKESGPFHPDRAARLLVDICHGVQAANDKGIVHRDLKPNNVLLAPNGRVKVTDFGLTKSVAEAGVLVAAGGPDDTPEHSGTLTRTGQSAGGTPGFLAPEQADVDFARIDSRADVWGLGATLFCLVVGRPPFPGGKENMRRVLTDPLVPPHEIDPNVPRDLSEIVVRCLRKQPDDRYPSAAAVADDLTKFLNRDSTAARPQPWVQRQWRRVSRTHPGWWVATVVVLLAAAVGVSLAMVPKPKPPADPLVVLQEKLRAGQEVPLVEGGQPPANPDWLYDAPPILPPADPSDGFSFASRELAALALLRDPGVDRYRITAVIRHEPVTEEAESALSVSGDSVGVFWAYRSTEYQDGTRVAAAMALAFSDRQPKPPAKRDNLLEYQDLGRVDSPLQFFRMQRRRGVNAPLPARPALPGPWRELVADVSPEGVTVHLPTGAKFLPAADLSKRVGKLEADQLVLVPGRDLPTREWTPRAPLGVYTDCGRIGVRRFVVSPYPHP